MMDAFVEPGVSEVVVMWATQTGKTEGLNNVTGFYIAHEPCAIMVLQPTLPMAQYWSKKRLAPMLRDTPALSGKVALDSKAKDSSNTILEKDFTGGSITIAGANSPASLASRPIRVLLCDEVNKYPASAGTEGDPISLARERTSNFRKRKIGMTSTPGIKGICRIEHAFEQTDKRYYHVPCPNCEEMIALKWGGPKADFGLKWDKDNPADVYYICQECGGVAYESDKARMLTLGEWIPTAEFNGKAGFHLNKLYSPWKTWPEIVADFLDKKKLPETLKVFVNSTLAETWEEKGDQVETTPLLARREHYGPKIPNDVLVITAGVDVQEDRVEIGIKGFGQNMETWLLDYIVIPGDFESKQVQADLDQQWERVYQAEDGTGLHIASVMIDSGHKTQAVYDYVRPREIRRIFAVKGVSQASHVVVKRSQSKNKAGATVHAVGVDQAKELIYNHLKIVEPGPGYCHFPFEGVQTGRPIDEDYFNGLTAEKRITDTKDGFPKLKWIQTRKRNEPLDCDVYAHAAFYNLNANLNAIERKREKQAQGSSQGVQVETQSSPQDQAAPTQARGKPARPGRRKGGFVNSWRGKR